MATSGNGWIASPNPAAIGIVPFHPLGVTPFANGGFPAGIKGGDVEAVFTWLVEQLHAHVEPMMTDPNTGQLGYGCWAYSYRPNVNNPNSLSNHSSGTAIDYNAPRHPNGTYVGPAGGGGWTAEQAMKIRVLVNKAGVIRWLSGNDPMHFEIAPGASAADVESAANRLGRDNIPGAPGAPTPPDTSAPTPAPAPTQEDDDMARIFYILGTDGTIWQTGDFVTRAKVPSMDRLKEALYNAQKATTPTGPAAQCYLFANGGWVPFTDAAQLNGASKQATVDQFGVAPAAQAAPAGQPSPKTYTVVAGDTVSGIAKRFGITPEQLRGWNGLNPTKDADLRIGLNLKVSA